MFMEWLIYIVSGILGASIGSFANVIALRLYSKEAFLELQARSHCTTCKHVLQWFELIPVVSFVLQRGTCRRCKAVLTVRYLVVEVIGGILFVITAHALLDSGNPSSWLMIALWWLMIGGLIVIFLYDLDHYLIPNVVLYPLIAIALLFFSITDIGSLMTRIISGFSAAAFFYIIHIATRGRGMGFGDVKLVVLIGLLLGPVGTIVALFGAFISGSIIGVALIAQHKKGLKSQIPFGPFLIGSTIVTAVVSFFYDITQLANYFAISL